MLNSADYYKFSDLLYSVCIKTIDHLSFKFSIFSGHIASFKIRVFRILIILNFHSCISTKSNDFVLVHTFSWKKSGKR